ncbi:MAG: hypothetical protein WCO00_13160 [Rhodospirillaceae bacterium]
MLKSLSTQDVGPARSFDIEFGERLNVITGDNGLGKSFLLDLAWWVCARDWPDKPALPSLLADASVKMAPKLSATLDGLVKKNATASYQFVSEQADWKRQGAGKPTIPGLVLYMRIDGGFSVWDPARHYFKRYVTRGIDDKDRAPAFHLTKKEVWEGARDEADVKVSRGLLVDWLDWQNSDSPAFTVLKAVLELLSPNGEPIEVHPKSVRLPGPSVDRIPALNMPYGVLPVTLASAGLKRVLALAYLIVSMWTEHCEACESNRMERQKQIIIIADEIEPHLHPQWQRRILPAMLKVGKKLEGTPDHAYPVDTYTH